MFYLVLMANTFGAVVLPVPYATMEACLYAGRNARAIDERGSKALDFLPTVEWMQGNRAFYPVCVAGAPQK